MSSLNTTRSLERAMLIKIHGHMMIRFTVQNGDPFYDLDIGDWYVDLYGDWYVDLYLENQPASVGKEFEENLDLRRICHYGY